MRARLFRSSPRRKAAQVTVTVPGAPTAFGSNNIANGFSQGTITFGWVAPVNNGGATITGYRFTAIRAGVSLTAVDVAGTSTSLTWSANPTTSAQYSSDNYEFTVQAINSAGVGPAAITSAEFGGD